MAEVTFESVKLLKPEPGEVVIVTLNEQQAGEDLVAATEGLAAMFPHNHVVILEHGDAVEKVPNVVAAIAYLEDLRG